MHPSVVSFIFARGGSKGLPKKNLRLLAGKPLVGWAIEVARLCPSIQRVIVSTDDEEIAATAQQYGAEVPFMRPSELAGDTTPEWLAWQHAIRTMEAIDGYRTEIMVSVPSTSPLRSVEDVESCVHTLIQSNVDIAITVTPSARNPFFNMVTFANGRARLVMQPPHPTYCRQDAPEVFDITTVAYAARTDFVLRSNYLFEGEVCAAVVPPERALDIDTELDLQFAEFLLSRPSLGNGG
jgi:N-acylneuraminate cytidylyltransferase